MRENGQNERNERGKGCEDGEFGRETVEPTDKTDLPFGFVHFSPGLGQPADREVVEASDHSQKSVVGMEVKQVLRGGTSVHNIA